ncbi:MAG TPA: T9SS type A sorting domain-containing protein [Agriterribacter sp.]|nr:T9SS type A sorting domain-containing protein [Chitinophagaceae bacterium]HRP32267.1 T9SS type A sorting domain-containing protein [Agriterribacter sp.]
MKLNFYPLGKTWLQKMVMMLSMITICMEALAQPPADSATHSWPVSIGRPCSGGSNSAHVFKYNGITRTLTDFENCIPDLKGPGFSIWGAGVSFNPADHMLYYYRYTGGDTYVWRWTPGSGCPPKTAVFQKYDNKAILGFAFDPNGLCYQLIFTGSGPYGLALRTVDFSLGTFGPQKTINLPVGVNITQQSGDLTLSPDGKMLMVWDKKYLTVNYEDYASPNPLNATLVANLTGNQIIGLNFAEGKLMAADDNNKYWELDILTGTRTAITQTPCYQSNDLTEIISGIGVAKKLSSAIPTGVPGQYNLSYDIHVRNYGGWPVDNLQVTDVLRGNGITSPFTGANNPTNITVTLIDNPAGVALNPSYNGWTNSNLLAAGQTLPNVPTANNHFTIRISFRVSGIVIGKVYNNNARVSGNGYANWPLLDISTNGDNPDLNNNAKPNDPGENQPTPFVVLTTAEMPPCDALNKILYKQEFGTGTTMTTAIPAATGSAGVAATDYTGNTTAPLNVEEYTLTRNANNANTTQWISRTDHTGNSNGKMMVVNADVKANKVYTDKINISCGNLKYSLFAFVSNIPNATYNTFCDAFGGTVKPKLTFTVKDAASGLIITTLTTPEITSANWTQYGMKFVMPATVNGSPVTQIIIEISNAAAGGCGNDLAIDDIQFGLCDPTPTVSVNNTAGCTSGITTFSAALNDTTVISGPLDYQWQVSSDSLNWTNIPGATAVDYTINPLLPADIGKYYRVIVAAAGNVNNVNCRYISNGFRLLAKTSSVAPTSINASPAATTCPGNAVNLTVQGGSLGTNAVWRWYRNSCGDTLIGTGTMISVLPSETTTYYVRAEGDCNTTACAQVTITVQPCVILPVEFLQFSAVQRTSSIDLDWRIITTEQISHFEVERSDDGSTFNKIGVVSGNGIPYNTTVKFNYQDTNTEFNGNIIYYRIKVVGKTGVSKYSNILTVRLASLQSSKLKISPNPASSSVNVSFFAALRGTAEVQLMDMTGKIVLSEQRMVEPGQNSITLNQLSRLSEGIYTIVVRTGEKWERDRILIRR